MTKQCKRCSNILPLESFNFKNKAKGTRNAWCSECNKAYQKTHYSSNKETYVAKAVEWKRSYRSMIYGWMRDYVLDHPCVDCGIDDFRIVHFDHKDQLTKEFEISKAIAGAYSLPKILDEVAKCDVRCANHHALRTAEQLGYYSDLSL